MTSISSQGIRDELSLLGYTNLTEEQILEVERQVSKLIEEVGTDGESTDETPVIGKLRRELEEVGYTNLPHDIIMSIHDELELLVKSSGLSLHDLMSTGDDVDSVTVGQMETPGDRVSIAGSVNTLQEDDGLDELTTKQTFTRKIARKSVLGESWVENVEVPMQQDDVDSIISVQSSFHQSAMNAKKQSTNHGRSMRKPKSYILPLQSVPHTFKKFDPVRRYHFYRKMWEKYNTPGQSNRSELRWKTRYKLTDRDTVLERQKSAGIRKKVDEEFVRKLLDADENESLSMISPASIRWLRKNISKQVVSSESVDSGDGCGLDPPPEVPPTRYTTHPGMAKTQEPNPMVTELLEHRLRECEEEYRNELEKVLNQKA